MTSARTSSRALLCSLCSLLGVLSCDPVELTLFSQLVTQDAGTPPLEPPTARDAGNAGDASDGAPPLPPMGPEQPACVSDACQACVDSEGTCLLEEICHPITGACITPCDPTDAATCPSGLICHSVWTVCRQCETDAECGGSAPACNPNTGTCAACLVPANNLETSPYCTSDPTRPYCEETTLTCQECALDEHCAVGERCIVEANEPEEGLHCED